MKIINIEVEKLFGVFNHQIPLNNDDNITIVIGENGLGKTVILEALNAFFGGNYRFFDTLEFEFFTFYFDNNDVWTLTKKSGRGGSSLYIQKGSPEKTNKKHSRYQISHEETPRGQKNRIRSLEMRRRELEYQYRINNSYSSYSSHDEMEYHELRRRNELEKFHQMQMHFESEKKINPPKWFLEGIKKINLKLIETQRIMTIKESGSDAYINNVRKCSDELKEMISNAAIKSSSVTSELDRTYPNRLITKLKQGSQDSFEELNEALAKLDKRRKVLSSVGLMLDSQDSDLLQIDEKQKDVVKLLKLYIDDSHKKLDPFEDLSKKIELFKEIINKRFKHKALEIQQDRGLVFRSTVKHDKDGKFETIPSSRLSSGEQNELILFYKLIFNSQNGDMILIDEPELSLHISWQNKFIDDLKNVTSINEVSIIIATHSPDIIHDNWDLRIELVGVE